MSSDPKSFPPPGKANNPLPMAPPVAGAPVAPAESVGYQPISGWAITGFILGALFALLVASSVGVGSGCCTS